MRKALLCAGTVVGMALLVFSQVAAAGGTSRRYVVVFERGASAHDAAKAIHKAGGKILSINHDIGVASVTSSDSRFGAKAAKQKALFGAAQERVIGRAPGAGRKPRLACHRVRRRSRQAARPPAIRRSRSTATSCRACSGT